MCMYVCVSIVFMLAMILVGRVMVTQVTVRTRMWGMGGRGNCTLTPSLNPLTRK